MAIATDLGTAEMIGGLQQLERRLRHMGITRLAIFGSRARGDYRPDSDLDVLIDVEGGRKFSLLDLVGVAHAIEDTMDVKANVFMRRSLNAQMAASIQPDIIEVFS